MSRAVLIRPQAKADIRAAAHWYEKQRKGLGRKFLQGVNEAIERICKTPKANPVAMDDVRRLVLRRFSYALYYQIEEHRVVIIGVFHTKRDPQIWRERIKEATPENPE